jgi:hypothetical protein
MDGLRINQVRKKEELSDKAKKGGCSNLREQVIEEPQMWLTPSATNITERSEEGMEKREKMRNDRGRKTVPPGSLAEQVDYGYPIKDMKEAEMWPTPTQDMTTERKKKYAQGGKPLTMAVQEEEQKMWPTPRATERMAYHESPSPSMIKGTHGWSLPAAITDEASENPNRMWPTPRASSAMAEDIKNLQKRGRDKSNLEEKVALDLEKMLPTPTARDYKGARKPETLKKAGRNENNSLPDKVAARQKGTLNPNWVEWLMGYPPGWTDIKDSE